MFAVLYTKNTIRKTVLSLMQGSLALRAVRAHVLSFFVDIEIVFEHCRPEWFAKEESLSFWKLYALSVGWLIDIKNNFRMLKNHNGTKKI